MRIKPSRRRLDINAVEERTGYHRQSIWRFYTTGTFPKPHYLGAERRWYEDELELWENEQMARRAQEKGVA
jgi:predicted DNA-binding transcriptional regulator AlpA